MSFPLFGRIFLSDLGLFQIYLLLILLEFFDEVYGFNIENMGDFVLLDTSSQMLFLQIHVFVVEFVLAGVEQFEMGAAFA